MSTTITSASRRDRGRLRELADVIRAAVLRATLAPDPEAKAACWDEYRVARAEALSMLSDVPAPDAVR
jgi:hypothetical protein